jgi:hypothetical protein
MAQAIHLGIDELEARFRVARDVVERTHCQVVWLLARGYAVADVAELVAMTPRWVNALARRYERDGIEALGDRPRHNHGVSPLLSEADLEALRQRLATPPDDGVLWTSPHGGELAVNRHFASIDDLDAVLAERCCTLYPEQDLIAPHTNFHWWPKPVTQN